MQALVVSTLFVALLIAVFALQNTDPETLNFLFWSFRVPRIITILGSAFAGALAVFLAGFFRRRVRTVQKTDVPREPEAIPAASPEDQGTNHG